MRVRRWLIYGGLAAAVYFAVFGGEYSLLELRRIERERARTQAELDSLRAELARARARIDSLRTDPSAIERVARERYGMIRDGERLYRFIEGAPPDSTAATDGRDSAPDSTGSDVDPGR